MNYSSVLLITSDNDERVPAFHTCKFAAVLQNRKSQTNLVLMKVRKGSGHRGSSSWYGGVKGESGFI